MLTGVVFQPAALHERQWDASDALRVAAHHEAGHAVVMWHHGHDFDSVSIYPDRPGLGRVICRSVLDELPPQELWRQDEATWSRAAERIMREVEWTLAGPLAEARHVAEPIGPALASFDDVYEAIGLLGRLRHAEHGRKKLTPQEIKEIYRDLDHARERVEQIFGEAWLWQAVEALAATLLVQGSVAGARAREIFRQQGSVD